VTDVLNELALWDWLTEHVEGFQRPASISKFPGGQSNPTYRIDARSRAYVLRRKPFGELLPSAHAIDREFRLLSALWPLGFPVPKPFALCEDLNVIGTTFYVMEMAAGQNHWNGGLPNLSGIQRRTTYLAMVDTLAELHRIDVSAAGLEDYGKSGNYFERQVARWTRQYRQSQTEHIEEIERLIEWLPSTIPQQTRSSIVHGDYRIDNLIFTKDDKVGAVLDWELSTLGDPLADFSYFALQWVLPCDGGAALEGLNLTGLNIPTLEEVVARYCNATGREGLPNLDWYFAYNLFRAAGIVQGIKKRIVDGTASHAQAHEMAARVPLYAQKAWSFAVSAQSRDGSI
jgi:aminoglycoside phosphotransferase (APT) family kinase protein